MSARTCAPRVRPSSTASAADLSLRRILHAAGTDSPEVPVVSAATSALAAYWNGRYAAPPFASPSRRRAATGGARGKDEVRQRVLGRVREERAAERRRVLVRAPRAAAFTEAARRRACATTSESASFAAARASPRPHPATSAAARRTRGSSRASPPRAEPSRSNPRAPSRSSARPRRTARGDRRVIGARHDEGRLRRRRAEPRVVRAGSGAGVVGGVENLREDAEGAADGVAARRRVRRAARARASRRTRRRAPSWRARGARRRR